MPTIKKLPKTNTVSEKKRIRARFYGKTEWKKLRDWYLMEHPLCEMCLDKNIENENGKKEEKVNPAEDVHHIISPFQFEDENTMLRYFLDYSNLKSLCKWHHAMQHKRNSKLP